MDEMLTMATICYLDRLRQHTEGDPAELGRNANSGRLAIQARNEGGNNVTEVHLFDSGAWLTSGSCSVRMELGTLMRQLKCPR